METISAVRHRLYGKVHEHGYVASQIKYTEVYDIRMGYETVALRLAD